MLAAEPPVSPPASVSENAPSVTTAKLVARVKDLWARHRPRRSDSNDTDNSATERTLIENIEDLGTLTAEDVMVPRIDIVALDIGTSTEDFMNLIKETPHSRIPVYHGTLDDIAGFVHIKDVLRVMAQNEPVVMAQLLRPGMIVSPSMRALDLLVEMRKSKRHLAFVVDEYGGIDGLVTMGDLIEAIVGEISDEHNIATAPKLFERPDGTIIIDARYDLTSFEKIYGEIFAENERNEADTMGGLAMFLAGRLPKRGELLEHESGVTMEIIDADPRRVKRLRLRNVPNVAAAQNNASNNSSQAAE